MKITAISETSNEFASVVCCLCSTRIGQEHTTPLHSKMYNDKTEQKGYTKRLANGILPPQSANNPPFY